MFTLEQFVLNERTQLDKNGVGLVGNYEVESSQIGDKMHADPGLYRPYRDEKGRVWVDVTVGNEMIKDDYNRPVMNDRGEPKWRAIKIPQLVSERRRKDLPVINVTDNATVLRKDQWIMIDQVVGMAARKRMRAWSDLRAANTMGGFDGMAVPILEFERLTDRGEAVVDMDGLSEGNNFQPEFGLQGMPLPITHCDFSLSQRYLASSRRGGGPAADTTRAEMAGRRVGETIEQTTIGTQTGITYGTSTDYAQTSQVYGYTNHPERITVTGATAPTGANGTTILTEWLDHRDELYQQNFYGPYIVYTATSYDQHLDNLFSTSEPSAGTLRQNLMNIQGIQDIRRLDYLTTSGTTIWVDVGTGNVKAVNGMEVTTVQWTRKGGLELRFKVMTIQAPMIQSVYVNTSTTGPAAGTTLKAPVLHVTT